VVDESPLRKPPWLKSPTLGDGRTSEIRGQLGRLGVGTVCSEAACPNLGRCFSKSTATFLILGRTCTRRCSYCAVTKAMGKPLPPPDPAEPEAVAEAVRVLGLRHAVVTSVTRDDLPDGGASHFASTILAVRARNQGAGIEVLTPDFGGEMRSLEKLADSVPDVFGHNLETVERLFDEVRPGASFGRSLRVLSEFGRILPAAPTKSGLMLGMGETEQELLSAIEALLENGVRMLTLGQYLQPGRSSRPVARYLHPEEFEKWRLTALEMGFRAVASGPLVRSSYEAGRTLAEFRASSLRSGSCG
jgi:lipoic acid synthetase